MVFNSLHSGGIMCTIRNQTLKSRVWKWVWKKMKVKDINFGVFVLYMQVSSGADMGVNIQLTHNANHNWSKKLKKKPIILFLQKTYWMYFRSHSENWFNPNKMNSSKLIVSNLRTPLISSRVFRAIEDGDV